MDRNKSLELLRTHVKNENLVKHCLASEAVMRALAARLGENADFWGLAGLLHDLDVELTAGDPARHTAEAEKLLRESGYPEDLIKAVRMHNEISTGQARAEKFHHALAAAETITGLIIATTLVYPDKKLASVKLESVLKRMKDKRFAATVNRDIILECEKIGVPLPDFAALALEAMRGISPDLGL